MPRPAVLFSTHPWDAVLDAQRTVLRAQIFGLSGDYLKGRDPEAVAAVLADEHAMAPAKVHTNRITIGPAQACGEPELDFALLRAAVSQEAVYQARMPFEGDAGMLEVSPLERPGAPPPGRVGPGYLELTLAGSGLTHEVLGEYARGWAASVAIWLASQAASVGDHKQEMRRFALGLIGRRIDELAAEEGLWADLDMLKRRPAA
jgi:hypothetical protein